MTTSSQPIDTAPRRIGGGPAAAGMALLAAGAITLFGGIAVELTGNHVPDDRYSSPYTASAFVIVSIMAALSHVLVLPALVRLRRDRFAGPSRGARNGLRLSFAATALLVPCELLGLAARNQLETATLPTIAGIGFGLATLVFCVGTGLAGRAALRDGVWRDGRRYFLIAWAVATVPLLILGPTDLFGWGLVLWSLPMLALGGALVRPPA